MGARSRHKTAYRLHTIRLVQHLTASAGVPGNAFLPAPTFTLRFLVSISLLPSLVVGDKSSKILIPMLKCPIL